VKHKAAYRPQEDEHRFRRQHDVIERVTEQIADADGNIGNPWRSVRLLVGMERSKRISPAMRAAGDRFHELFRLAHLDPLKAADMSRVGSGGRAMGYRGSIKAHEEVARALAALGGPSSAAGCCAWFVLGCEYSLTQWGSGEGWRGRAVRPEEASGMLISALGVLERHFEV
jgi:Domain of unknown function (DUF6456)